MPTQNMVARRRKRRTQQERRAETRGRLLDAAVECLFRLGYNGTTTTAVCAQANMSRGAQLHHFPTKAELVVAAVEHLFERRNVEFRRAMDALPDDVDRGSSAIDMLWAMINSPTYFAWLEVVVAARTDPALRKSIHRVNERFMAVTSATFGKLFPDLGTGPMAEMTLQFVFIVLEGMAVNQLCEGEDRSAAPIAILKDLSRLIAHNPQRLFSERSF